MYVLMELLALWFAQMYLKEMNDNLKFVDL